MKQLIVPMLLVRNMGPKAVWASVAAWVLLLASTMALTEASKAMLDPIMPARRSRAAWRRAARRTARKVRVLMSGAPCC